MSEAAVKASQSSSLPRAARARVGETTDPVPEGKVLDAAPEHHFKVVPADHDVKKAHSKSPADLSLTERQTNQKEINKMHEQESKGIQKLHQKAAHGGMDYAGASTAANKLMDSRHHTVDF